MKEKVTKGTSINKILKICPDASKILKEIDLHCIGCPVAGMESLEQGAKAHGLSDEEIEELVKKINQKIKAKSA